jgi:DNA-binding CsgD family transcriptional regulator
LDEQGEKQTKPDNTRRKTKSAVKTLRDQTVLVKAIGGKSASQIASEVGLTRQTVSEILNSDEAKAAITDQISRINGRLAEGIEDAIKTVLAAVKTDYPAARDLLRHFGALRQDIEFTATRRLTLEELVTGANAAITEDSEC